MKHRQKKSSKELIAEMMLAKAVLEEKNEILDQKERTIRELRTNVEQVESEIETLHEELERCRFELSGIRETALKEGFVQIVTEVVQMLSDRLVGDTNPGLDLAIRLLGLFREKYGLEVIEEPPEKIDPEIHRVIVVDYDPEAEPTIQVLARGFRLGGKTLAPALVKVIQRKSTDFFDTRMSCGG